MNYFEMLGDANAAATMRDDTDGPQAAMPTSASVRQDERLLAILRKLRLPLPRER